VRALAALFLVVDPSSSSTSSSAASTSNSSTAAAAKPPSIYEAKIQTLVEMGFDAARSEAALRRNQWDQHRAVDDLMTRT